jgi:ribonuclease HI
LAIKVREMQIEVRMDSELVVRQLGGIYKVKEPTLKEQFARVGASSSVYK